MKHNYRFSTLAIATILVTLMSACGTARPMQDGNASGWASKGGVVSEVAQEAGQASPVEFTGTIEAMNGNQWTVNRMTVFVSPQALAGANVSVGDTVRFRGSMLADGTVTASKVGQPAMTGGFLDETANNNSNGNSNANESPNEETDDQEIVGTVEAINGDQITIDGVTYTVSSGIDLSTIAVGDMVKVEFVTNTDGSMTITELETTASIGENDNDEDMEENSNGNSNSNSNEDDDDEGEGEDDD